MKIAPEFIEKSPELAKMILNTVESENKYCEIVYLLTEDGNKTIVGFVWGQIDRSKIGFIREFFIKPSYRLCGYGKQIYHHLELYFINNGISKLWLTADERVRKFWESVGFEKTLEIYEYNGLPVYIKTLFNNKRNISN